MCRHHYRNNIIAFFCPSVADSIIKREGKEIWTEYLQTLLFQSEGALNMNAFLAAD